MLKDEILKGVHQFGEMFLSNPQYVFMSSDTYNALREEVNVSRSAVTKLFGLPPVENLGICELYGMKIIIRNDLPLNMCVIDGIIVHEDGKERSKTE